MSKIFPVGHTHIRWAIRRGTDFPQRVDIGVFFRVLVILSRDFLWVGNTYNRTCGWTRSLKDCVWWDYYTVSRTTRTGHGAVTRAWFYQWILPLEILNFRLWDPLVAMKHICFFAAQGPFSDMGNNRHHHFKWYVSFKPPQLHVFFPCTFTTFQSVSHENAEAVSLLTIQDIYAADEFQLWWNPRACWHWITLPPHPSRRPMTDLGSWSFVLKD